MKTLLLLGSTGSIGTQTLDIVRQAPGDFRVRALGARTSWKAVLEQAREFNPEVVGLVDEEAAQALRPHLAPEIALIQGPEAMLELCRNVQYDVAVHGIVGAAGLQPSMEVCERGKTLALANKESLVVAGELLMDLARRRGADILPVDSEHAAIFQCLRGEDKRRIRRVILTSSGGPLRDHSLEQLETVTPAEALAHPNWDMGPRISIDSATLMNKALEVIETHHLFGLPTDQIEVVVHRQSVVHSMVEFCDGSVMGQMGPPDMRGPIHFCLYHPERGPNKLTGFDLKLFSSLTFEEPDRKRFPGLELGYRAVAEGGSAGCTLNAADEVAVAAFLEGRIGFQDIGRVNRSVLDRRPRAGEDLQALLKLDADSRALAAETIDRLASEVPG